jgi:hypothetical protein
VDSSSYLSVLLSIVLGLAITRREWFHKLLAPAVGLLFLLYIALLFARL